MAAHSELHRTDGICDEKNWGEIVTAWSGFFIHFGLPFLVNSG